MGGEERARVTGRTWRAGLPPRGRGRVTADQIRPIGNRITPAWAGKRSAWAALGARVADYPRVGGEE